MHRPIHPLLLIIWPTTTIIIPIPFAMSKYSNLCCITIFALIERIVNHCKQ